MAETETPTAVDQARAAVDEARQVRARWEAEQATARAELEDLQRRAGDEVLNDPDAARRLPREMQEIRDRIEVAGRAAAAQAPRVTAAERVFLLADADSRQPAVDEAQRALDEYDAKTEKLLEAVRKHTGGKYIREPYLDVFLHGPQTIIDNRFPLERALEEAEQPVAALRAMAERKVPNVPTSVLPDTVWGPDAVVRAPGWDLANPEPSEVLENLRRLRPTYVERVERFERLERIGDTRRKIAGSDEVVVTQHHLDGEGRNVVGVDILISEAREALDHLDRQIAVLSA